MKNKYIRGLALGMAAMTAFTFTTPQASLLSVEAATATKATKGTSKITASKKTVKVAKGNTATVKLTLNKKQAKDLKITVKSKSSKIAKVTNAKKVIVKKGKKVASVKIKGVKANSSTKVVASFKTSAGKTKKVTITVKVNPIALTKVTLNNKTPKVGDTLTATISPSNASAVTYKWYMGDSTDKVTTVISGQTKKTLTVTDAMAGKFIKVVATGKTAAGKAASKSATTTAAVEAKTTPEPEPTTPDIVDTKVAVTGVSLSNTAPKVGDTLTATVAPENATNVKYAWYLGNSSNGLTDLISGETTKEIKITKEMVGKYLGVVVSGEDNSSANAATAVAIQEADSTNIAIVSAEQTGAKSVKVTFSNPVTSNDKITVKKGSDNVAIDGAVDYAADFLSATLTLADKITTSEYEITLTPADTKVAATSAKFTGQISELKEIRFLNDYLVMKDNDYAEGYAYAKGFDQFGGEVTLSGLTVNSGVGQFKSYDNATGKITIVDQNKKDNNTGAFMLIKEVPVFIQYQQGNNVISANKTLTVSTRSYVSDVEFGEVKKDGTARKDGRLTMTELRSGKYYVEFNKIKDQYGNDLSAEDLNEQKRTDGKGAVLFVIPSNTGAFYTTENFGTLNGKTILWLNGNDKSKPGTMALTLTGAGGATFSKEITVEDDPYIDNLTVSYPELYSGQGKSSKMEFSAVDQYGEVVDLWDVRPSVKSGDTTVIEFGDKNNMTGQCTKIQVSGGVHFNEVLTDSAKRTFTVTLDCNHANGKNADTKAVAAKVMAVFTATSAGMKVATHSVTVGEVGAAAKVKSSFVKGTDTQLTNEYGDNQSINFAQKLQFEDANGNTMVRGVSEGYPGYVNLAGVPSSSIVDVDSSVKNSDYTGYTWTLTENKIKAGTTPQTVTDGVVKYSYLGDNSSKDYYVTVYGKYNSKYYILDDQDFHLTKVTGKEMKTFTATVDGKIYTDLGVRDKDYAEVKVKATTENGETFDVAPSKVELVVAGNFESVNNKVYGKNSVDYKDDTSGEQQVAVWVNTPTGKKEAGTVNVPYSNVQPVATTVKFKQYTQSTDPLVGSASLVGADFDGDISDIEFNSFASQRTKMVLDKTTGTLNIYYANNVGDRFEAYIEDQYGQRMSDTAFFIDGTDVSKTTTAKSYAAGRYAVQYTNGNQSGKFYENFLNGADLTVIDASANYTIYDVATPGIGFTVGTDTTTDNKLDVAGASSLTVAKGATLTVTNGLEVKTGGTVEVVTPGTLTTSGDVINHGTMRINGYWNHTTTGTIFNYGQVVGTGHVTVSGTVISGSNGVFNVGGNTLELRNVTVGGKQKVTGNVRVDGTVKTENGGALELQAGTTLTVKTGSYMAPGSVTVPENVAVTVNTVDESGALIRTTPITGDKDNANKLTATLIEQGSTSATEPDADFNALQAKLYAEGASTVDMTENVTIGESNTLHIPAGVTLNMGSFKLTNNNAITNSGSINATSGTIDGNGRLTMSGSASLNSKTVAQLAPIGANLIDKSDSPATDLGTYTVDWYVSGVASNKISVYAKISETGAKIHKSNAEFGKAFGYWTGIGVNKELFKTDPADIKFGLVNASGAYQDYEGLTGDTKYQNSADGTTDGSPAYYGFYKGLKRAADSSASSSVNKESVWTMSNGKYSTNAKLEFAGKSTDKYEYNITFEIEPATT